ncbi:MAG TPA: alkaline phosphatase family protein [Terriglobia bacterium]|nr:alkaline phosphatase family protein [Terriglobia bacterium]
MPTGIQHVFVLMLENRSFDHMLGFADISGTDAVSGAPTQISGLISPPAGAVTSNLYGGQQFSVTQPADYAMPVDPGHEFPAVLEQLCGSGAVYAKGGAYPAILNSGFAASYAAASAAVKVQSSPGEIMKCYNTASQLPVLNRLAEEFVVCDNWFSSMPGPTWPNRFFVHAASSGGLDHSPSTDEIVEWESIDGFSFSNGTIFDRLDKSGVKWRLYAGDDFPSVGALKGIKLTQVHGYDHFADDVAQSGYPAAYTFIEPSYGHVVTDYKCGTSQHPLDDVTRGEMLIKCTYEAIRNSPLWDTSLLIITWDEHGGFFDHVAPPPAVAPADTTPTARNNQYGFTFEQYGVRVPAIVISPLIPGNLIDHRLYDHSSILATVEACFGLYAMTERDATANNLTPLLSSSSATDDAPAELPSPVSSGIGGCEPFSCSTPRTLESVPAARPEDQINEGNLPGIMHSVLREDLALSPPDQREAIVRRFETLRTRGDAWEYRNEVKEKIRAAREGP